VKIVVGLLVGGGTTFCVHLLFTKNCTDL